LLTSVPTRLSPDCGSAIDVADRKQQTMMRSEAPRHEATPRILRRGAAASVAVAIFTLIVGMPSAAWADGPTTFSNTTAIAIPESGPASPYPASITVSGMAGPVTSAQVVLHGVTHSALSDVDVMVVAPSGENLVVLSDAGDGSTTASNATLTFDDAAAGSVPSGTVTTGIYRPTNVGAGDAFPSPAPAPSSATTLAGAFTGIDPNGTWTLYVVDDSSGDAGSIAGGWSVVVTTDPAVAATTTTVSTSGSPSTTGNSVTFTATVSAAGSPVTDGFATFYLDGSLIASLPLSGAGTAQLTTSALTEGTHLITATYSGSTGFLTSTGSLSQRVDNQTVVTGQTYCNTGVVTVPSDGPASPYPSNITVTGLTGVVTSVTATLHSLSHAVPSDLDVMLSGPTPATNLLLMSDSGGATSVSDATIVFADDAADPVPTPLVSGTFRPSDDDSAGADAAFPTPAPVISSATTLATFNGTSGNGVWSLWTVDDEAGDAGSINGGWCLTFTTAVAPPPDSTPTDDPLAATGASDAAGLTLAAGGLLFFGAAMVVVARRRRLSRQS
jgi:subtilisin-like proprotein convertase family protein